MKILTLLLAITTLASAAFQCPGNGNYPNPDDCASFYSCGVAGYQLINCPYPLQFNSEKQICVEIKDSDCYKQSTTTKAPTTTTSSTTSTTTTTPTSTTTSLTTTTTTAKTTTNKPTTPSPNQPICSSTVYDFIQNPNDCTTFYKCNDDKYVLLNCPSGYGFDPASKDCLPVEEIGCTTTATPAPPVTGVSCPSTGQSIVPNEETCDNFYLCTNGHADRISCPVDYLFDKNSKKCEPKESVNCNGENPIPDPNECKTRPNGSFFPDPYDCTKYYQCSNGEAVSNNCPPGLEFNAAQSVCDSPLNAKCQEISKY